MQLQSHATRLLHLGVVASFLTTAAFAVDNMHTSSVFKGAKVNGGTVTHLREGGKSLLRVSDDFQIPNTPDPHWQVVDSKGEVHLLPALKLKEGLSNRQITLPKHVRDVAKVQIWCSFAETLLGEASFPAPVK